MRRAIVTLLVSSLPLAAAAAPDPGPLPAQAPFPVAGQLAGVRLEPVASGLGPITGIANAGDGRLFLTVSDGRILVVADGTLRPQPFLDLRGQVSTGGERGLFSVAFHPRYAASGWLFVNYTDPRGDTVIARYQVAPSDPGRADPSSARTLLVIPQPFANHNGGQNQFGPDGYLYVAMGDGGAAFDPGCRAQRTDTLLGKLLRLDVDQNVEVAPFYGIPADNPFRGPGDPPDEVWASGLRNPWRFSFDRATGDLWIADVGQGRREEVSFQPASSAGGENYGWKVMEGTLCGSRDGCPASTPGCDAPAFTDPVLEYEHGPHCSVTGGFVYRGAAVAALRGAYLFGDFCSGVIWAAFRQGGGFTVRTVGATLPQLTSFGEDAAGELYAATLDGRLVRFAAAPGAGAVQRVGLYDPVASRFHLKAANSSGGAVRTVRFGLRRGGWLPVAGDWDGDGVDTIGLYDPGRGLFRLKGATSGGTADLLVPVSPPSPAALPLSGDWDGDGRDGVALYDPDTGTFHLADSLDGSGFDRTVVLPQVAGGEAQPLSGDWDGDGHDGVGVFAAAPSTFTLRDPLEGGAPDLVVAFGPQQRGALPAAGDWDGDGRDGLALYDPRAAVFRLRQTAAPGDPDATFRFGPRRAGWLPLAGAW